MMLDDDVMLFYSLPFLSRRVINYLRRRQKTLSTIRSGQRSYIYSNARKHKHILYILISGQHEAGGREATGGPLLRVTPSDYETKPRDGPPYHGLGPLDSARVTSYGCVRSVGTWKALAGGEWISHKSTYDEAP